MTKLVLDCQYDIGAKGKGHVRILNILFTSRNQNSSFIV